MRPSSPVCPPAAQRRSQHTTQCSAHVGTRGSDIRPLFPPSRPSAWQVTRLLHPSEGRYACITLGQEHVIGGASGERLITRAHAVHVPLWLRSLSTPGSCAPPRLHAPFPPFLSPAILCTPPPPSYPCFSLSAYCAFPSLMLSPFSPPCPLLPPFHLHPPLSLPRAPPPVLPPALVRRHSHSASPSLGPLPPPSLPRHREAAAIPPPFVLLFLPLLLAPSPDPPTCLPLLLKG